MCVECAVVVGMNFREYELLRRRSKKYAQEKVHSKRLRGGRWLFRKQNVSRPAATRNGLTLHSASKMGEIYQQQTICHHNIASSDSQLEPILVGSTTRDIEPSEVEILSILGTSVVLAKLG
jgi:hypothetical protein